MAVDISVIGTGYVGLTAAIGLADFGNKVIGTDLDEKKVDMLNKGEPVIYEPGVQEYLKRNLESGRLSFTTNIDSGIRNSEVVFIAVGTPPKENGEADLYYIENVLNKISENLNGYKVIVTKSTVPVGTNRWIKNQIKEKANNSNFDVVSNPEFLREGRAIHDFFHPDRVVLGYETDRAKELLVDVYRALNLIQVPFLWCNLETAELIKYASNSFLATKITFINQMANLAEAIGGDIHQIAKAMGMDGRISSKFLHPGPGYGGSCFPKDTKAISSIGDAYNINMTLIKEVIRSNENQKRRMVEKLKKYINLDGKIITVLGLAFKSETDDIRESPALTVINTLLNEGAQVHAHDPKAIENFRKIYPNINYYSTEFEAINNADALVIVTDWNVYRNIDLKAVKEKMVGNIIIDTRNVLELEKVKELGFIYEGVGRL